MYHTNERILMIISCISQGRTPGEVFVPKSSKEAEMEKILKSMEVIVLSLVQSFISFNASVLLNVVPCSCLPFRVCQEPQA